MERRFEIRKREILQEADIKPEVADGMLKRLEQFVQPFIASLGRREPKQNARIYICGLLSDLERKNVESIAYRYDRDRRALQQFVGIPTSRDWWKNWYGRLASNLAKGMASLSLIRRGIKSAAMIR